MTRKRRSKQKKKKKITSKVDHMPAKLIEQILQNLPVKSLLRFSTASKLWNSIIFQPEFAQSYRGREVIVFRSLQRYESNTKCLSCPLSSISSDNPTVETTPFEFPPGSFRACCDYLWCLEFEKSLLLYNPSIRTYRKLPHPASLKRDDDDDDAYVKPDYVYGLGYDSVCDDYKILQIRSRSRFYHYYYNKYDHNFDSEFETEMYSLKSNCWRKIESQSPEIFSYFLSTKGLFVSGALYWLVARILSYDDYEGKGIEKNLILSFDLSEEKFGLMELPEELALPMPDFRSQRSEMTVFGGKLRVYLSSQSYDNPRISVWVMEDYESKLWIKEMEFDYGHMSSISYSYLRPFYFYDDVGNMVRALALNKEREKMLIYKEENGSKSTPTLVEKNFGSDVLCLVDSYTYVESFVSPNADDELMAALGKLRIDK